MHAAPHIRRGDAAAEIVAAAEALGADLIVVGSRGLGGLDRLLLGSVARDVLFHARRSVLITPDQVVARDRYRRRIGERVAARERSQRALAPL